MPDSDRQKVIPIPKEKAVFWMDDQGRWHNQHGPFEHRKLIAYFNSSIGKDEEGYFVIQSSGDVVEKVYFPYQVTAIFAVDILWQPVVKILLNTGSWLRLVPRALYIREDQLYMRHEGDIIKFSQQALIKLRKMIHERTSDAQRKIFEEEDPNSYHEPLAEDQAALSCRSK